MPSSDEILSSRMRGVLPTASRALSSMGLGGKDMMAVGDKKCCATSTANIRTDRTPHPEPDPSEVGTPGVNIDGVVQV